MQGLGYWFSKWIQTLLTAFRGTDFPWPDTASQVAFLQLKNDHHQNVWHPTQQGL